MLILANQKENKMQKEKERRVFYIDTKDLSIERAQEYIRKLMKEYKMKKGKKIKTKSENCCQYCCGKPLC